jgi:hypothetical protein
VLLYILQPEDLAVVTERGWSSRLDRSVGVAGLSNFDAVKCLHAHYCHYLGTVSNTQLMRTNLG